MDGTWGVTSALMGIERCDAERRRSRSDALSCCPAPPVAVAERVEDGARTREDAREEYVPVFCAVVFGGEGDSEGPDRRARLLLWKEEGASVDV